MLRSCSIEKCTLVLTNVAASRSIFNERIVDDSMDDSLVFSDSEDEIQIPGTDMEGFDDFTISSSWERLIAAVELASREWRASGRLHLMSCGAEHVQGLRDVYRVQGELSSRNKPYRLEFFFQATGDNDRREDWRSGLHHLQLWFGVSDFLLISPVSMSGVVLDASEATMLLSAVAVALSNCGSTWPVFVPVHDPTRKAYTGIQGTISSFSTRFDADKLCSQVPVKLMHLEGLYDLFLSKVAFTSPHDSSNLSTRVGFTMKLTYGTPMPGFEYVRDTESGSPEAEQSEDTEVDPMDNIQWDEECPWAEWHSLEDPIKGFELVTIWSNRYIGNSVEMAEFENVSTFEAEKWLLTPILSQEDEKGESVGFAGRLRSLVAAFFLTDGAKFMEDYVTATNPSITEFVQKLIVPPPTVLDRVLKDLFNSAASETAVTDWNFKEAHAIKAAPPHSLFSRFCLHTLWFGNCNIRAISALWVEFVREIRWCWEEAQLLPMVSPDGAPDLGTCLLHQKLQLLAKCIKHKSEKAAVATMSFSQSNSDKEQAGYQVGIRSNNEKPLESGTFSDLDGNSAQLRSTVSSFSDGLQDTDRDAYFQDKNIQPFWHLSDEGKSNNADLGESGEALQFRKGSAGCVENLVLLKTKEALHTPHVQVPPVMTEDMLLEREHALAALDRSPSGQIARLRLQSDILASDMASFKAANPGSVLEDFVHWRSSCDLVYAGQKAEGCQSLDSSFKDILSLSSEKVMVDVHDPVIGKLNSRLSEPEKSWAQIWKSVKAIPAADQKPLFDYIREGEKVIHYLDTLKPYQLLAQIICTAFVAATDILVQSSARELSLLDTEMEKLYASLSVTLKPLGSFHLSDEDVKGHMDQWRKNLSHLCDIFEKVESDATLAASLYIRLPEAPSRLLNALFGSYMVSQEGKAKTDIDWKESHVMLRSIPERETVASSLFTPSKASQTWKESLRMGNFLNGHEPLYREVIFSGYEECFDSYHEKTKTDAGVSFIRKQFTRRIQSHRMYICGTPNELQVAFSVVTDD